MSRVCIVIVIVIVNSNSIGTYIDSNCAGEEQRGSRPSLEVT